MKTEVHTCSFSSVVAETNRSLELYLARQPSLINELQGPVEDHVSKNQCSKEQLLRNNA